MALRGYRRLVHQRGSPSLKQWIDFDEYFSDSPRAPLDKDECLEMEDFIDQSANEMYSNSRVD